MLTLRDDKDNRIVNDNNFANITDSHITADLPAGTYTVVAATGGLPGGYSFNWQVKAHDLTPCSQVQKIDLNSAYVGILGESAAAPMASRPTIIRSPRRPMGLLRPS